MGFANSTVNWTNCADDNSFVYFSYVFFTIVFFPTIFGNGLIVASILRFHHLRCNMHILIGNLAVSDIVIGLSMILQVVGNLNYDLTEQKHYCLGHNAIFVISLGTSSFNLLAMSVERFTAIRFPLQHRNSLLARRITYIIIIIASWGYHFIIAFLPMFGWNNYKGEQLVCDTDLVWTKSYDILLFGSTFTVVTVNIALCCVVMRIILKGETKLGRTFSRSRKISTGSVNTSSLRNNLRRTKMTMLVFGVFAVCWMPYLILSLLLTVYDVPTVRCVRQWSICLGVINSAINWIIYGLANKCFREAFKAVLRCRDLASYTVRGSVKRP